MPNWNRPSVSGSPVHAVLLAAGRGKRLAPHTDRVPKPLLSLNGRPLLEYALHHLKRAGVIHVLIVVGYLGDRIRSHFGNGQRWGLDIAYVEQGSVPGTGAAALLAEPFVEGHPFFLGWGDILAAEAEYKRLFSLFAEESYEGVMLLEPVDNPQNGAAVEVVDGRVVSLVEKSAEARAPWNQAGLSIYTQSIFEALRAISLSERGELEFTAAVQQSIDDGAIIAGVPMQSPRLHLTRPEDIPKVEQVLSKDRRYAPSIAQFTGDD